VVEKERKGKRREAREDGVIRTVVVPSARLSYRTYFALAEVEREYSQMLKELVDFAYENGIASYIKLTSLKYREMRQKYPNLPSMYVVVACRDAATRVKSFLAKKERGEAYTERPAVRKVSIWLHAKLWKAEGRTAVRVATKRGWVTVELRPHRHFWRYANGGWALRSEARMGSTTAGASPTSTSSSKKSLSPTSRGASSQWMLTRTTSQCWLTARPTCLRPTSGG